MNQDHIRIPGQNLLIADRYPLLIRQIIENVMAACQADEKGLKIGSAVPKFDHIAL